MGNPGKRYQKEYCSRKSGGTEQCSEVKYKLLQSVFYKLNLAENKIKNCRKQHKKSCGDHPEQSKLVIRPGMSAIDNHTDNRPQNRCNHSSGQQCCTCDCACGKSNDVFHFNARFLVIYNMIFNGLLRTLTDKSAESVNVCKRP